MKRRDLIAGAAGAALSARLAAPALAQGAAARTLRFVPQANVSSLDPIWTTQFVIRNHSVLIFDTLFGINSRFEPKPQMAEGAETSGDGLSTTIRLREGLRFHTGEPVLARDVAQSLRRWMARDVMGGQIRLVLDEVVATDDRTVVIRLKRPYRQLLFALAKTGTNCAFIMPERIAATDPFQQISEAIGSGPYRFVRDEWVPGSRSVYQKFDAYVPRQEPGEWFSGGKIAAMERIEWQVMPDPATASAALQNGEVDWWETPLPDLVATLRRNRQIVVEQTDPLGNIGALRVNFLHKPFNHVKARQALMMAVNQADYMTALMGDDPSGWREMNSFFTPNTPLATELGKGVMTGPRSLDAARKLLAESGYANEKVILIAAMDIAITKVQSEVTADVLKKLGINVDFVATDWGSVGARRQKKDPPEQGGWHIFHTWFAGADCANPAAYSGMRANGGSAWFGWPEIPAVEAGIAEWFDSATPEAAKTAAEKIDQASISDVSYVPTGQFFLPQAWRRNITGIQKAPLPIFFGVRKG
jgi:peptide/nickel transport system substrate-binding protein